MPVDNLNSLSGYCIQSARPTVFALASRYPFATLRSPASSRAKSRSVSSLVSLLSSKAGLNRSGRNFRPARPIDGRQAGVSRTKPLPPPPNSRDPFQPFASRVLPSRPAFPLQRVVL